MSKLTAMLQAESREDYHINHVQNGNPYYMIGFYQGLITDIVELVGKDLLLNLSAANDAIHEREAELLRLLGEMK
jgi:hypothetical protein